MKLTWDGVAGATGYKITKSTTSEGTFDEVGTTIGNTATTYTVSSLTPGTRYYFKVQGVSGATEGTRSAEVTAIANVDGDGDIFVGNKLLASNESTDTASTQSTGSLSVNEEMSDINVLDLGELDPEAFRINPVIPFEPIEGQEPVNYNVEGELQTQEITYTLNTTKDFTTKNIEDNSYNTTTARCAYVGSHVVVWVDNDNSATVKLTNDEAELIGKEFDTNIYNLVTQNFYTESDVNNDSKVSILCFDIKDNYNGVGTGYVGGYFWGGDLYSKTIAPIVANSNEMEIFYADTYPTMIKNPTTPDCGDPDVTKVYSTLAHEFQHMVNFNCNVLTEPDKKDMDTWLNEALSMAAEDMYNGTQTNRINFYNSSTVVGSGCSLLEWDNDLANYSLSYLFSQYLRTQIDQANGSGQGVLTYKSIIEGSAEDYRAVENVIKTKIDNSLTFGQFMTNFRAAMLLKADSGPYGFNNEAGFDTITTPLYSSNEAIDLKGGGAIVKSISPPFNKPSNCGTLSFLGIYN